LKASNRSSPGKLKHASKNMLSSDATLPDVTGIDHFQIAGPRGCEGAARSFFGDVLGLAEVPKPETLRGRGGVWFAVGDHQLHVGIEEPFAPARKAHPAFRVTGIDELAARLEAAGHPPRWDDDLPGYRRFYVDDPFGNRIELLEPTG
jgi:catechol 2,3-dioxygenase-like lactoylglutathione lyase family enzyme